MFSSSTIYHKGNKMTTQTETTSTQTVKPIESTPEKRITIRTNNVPRDVIDAWSLTPDERKEFDYLDWQAIEEGRDSASFFRYRGELYDLGEFSRITPPGSRIMHPMECQNPDFQGWDEYQSDSFFSGMLIRYYREPGAREPDFERIVVASYCC